jgi:hypothetical protein
MVPVLEQVWQAFYSNDQTELSTRSRNVYRTSLVSKNGINCGQMMITDGF